MRWNDSLAKPNTHMLQFLQSLAVSALMVFLGRYLAGYLLNIHTKLLLCSKTIEGFYLKLYSIPFVIVTCLGVLHFYYQSVFSIPVHAKVYILVSPFYIAIYFVWVCSRLRKKNIKARRIYLQRQNWFMKPNI